MIHFAPVMLFFPLVGFLVLVTFGRRMGEKASGTIATAAIALSFVAALITFLGLFFNIREIIRISATTTEIFQYLIIIIFEYRNNNEISKL